MNHGLTEGDKLRISVQRHRIGELTGTLDTECGYGQQAFQTVASGQVIGTITARMFNGLGARDVEEGALQVAIRTANTSSNGHGISVGGPAYTLDQTQGQAVFDAMRVRKLTPVECERLQGFPDNHTRVPYRNKGADQCPDGPRYKAIGNSKAVPVVRWIGERLRRHNENFVD